MNVLIISLDYPPELRSNALMMREYAQSLVAKGHDASVVCAWPTCNLTDEDRMRRIETITDEDGVKVIRVKTLPTKKLPSVVRGVTELLLPRSFIRAIKSYSRQKFDVIIAYTPPLPLFMVGNYFKKKHQAFFQLNIQDIFPQNAIDLGIIKNRLIIGFYEMLERRAYGSADMLTSHTISSREFLIRKKGIPDGKIKYAPNWIDVTPYAGIKRTGAYRREYDLQDRFIFLFPGVIGWAQGLEVIIRSAALIKDLKKVCFLIVGDGVESEKMKQLSVKMGCDNIIFKPFVSSDNYPFLVKDADVGIVCLHKDMKTPVVPGKTLGFMAASIPVAAVLNRESDGHALIAEADCGQSINSDAPIEEIASMFRRMYEQKMKLPKMGENGFNYVKRHFDRNKSIDSMISILEQKHADRFCEPHRSELTGE